MCIFQDTISILLYNFSVSKDQLFTIEIFLQKEKGYICLLYVLKERKVTCKKIWHYDAMTAILQSSLEWNRVDA